MNFSQRLIEERNRLNLLQKDFAELAGVSIKSQVDYEKGRAPLFTAYLERIAAFGVDVQYVVTGRRVGEPGLTEEDRSLLVLFHRAGPTLRQAAIAVLSAGQTGGTIVGGDYIRASENARVYNRVGGSKRGKRDKAAMLPKK